MAVGNWQHWPGGAAPPPPPSNEIPWTPRQLASTAFWFDAEDTTCFANNETVVKSFSKVGDYTLTGQGTYLESGFLGNPTVSFNGTNDVLDTNGGDILNGAPDAWVFVAHTVDNGPSNPFLFHLSDTSSSNALFSMQPRSNGLIWFRVQTASISNTSGGSSAPGEYITGMRTAGSTLHAYQNGTELTLGNPTITSGFPAASNALIAIGNDNSGNHLDGNVSEVVVGNGTLSDSDRERIEGYLAHKWGLTSSLPTAHPYKSSAPTILTPFLPSDVSGLAAWWDPTTLDSPVGSEVSSLPDLGPRDLDLIPDTRQNSTGPVLSTTNAPNNRKYLDYASLDALWKDAPEEYFYRNCAGGTIFIVSRNDSTDGQFHYIYLIGTESGSSINNNQRAAFLKWNANDATAFGGRVPDNAGAQWVVGPNPMSTSWSLNCQRYDYVNTTAENFLNGALEFSTSSFQTSTRTTDLGPQYFTLGYRLNDGTDPHLWFEGGIAEVVIYDRTLSDDEREKIEGYLAHKYGLTLPAAHPYFSEPFGGALWHPAELGTAATRLEADSLGLADGDTVSSWPAVAGESYSAGSGITLDVDALDKPVASNDGLTSSIFTPNSSLATDCAGFSVFVVTVPRQASVEYVMVSRWSHNGERFTIKGIGGTFDLTSHKGQSVSGNDTLGNTATITGGTEVVGDAYILGGIADIGTDLTLSVNGTTFVNSSFGNPGDTFSDVVAQKAGFGTNKTGASPDAVDFGEVIAVNRAVTDDEREKIEGYLAHKWGLTASLPAAHPYKTSPPTI